MFRYLAFSWQPGNQVQSQIAERLEIALRNRGGWQAALEVVGHKVFMTGNRRGVNDAYPLPANQGVILGRLFHRSPTSGDARQDVGFSDLDAQRIIQSDGRALVEQYWGRYVAFLPSVSGEARVLRDPTGTLPCLRMKVEGVNVVCSWLEDVFALLRIPIPSVDWEPVAAHLLLGRLGGRETALAGVTHVLAGELTPLNAGGGTPQRLWNPVDFCRRAAAASPLEAARVLRDTVTACVTSWASCYDTFILRLSGGVDSSILLGTLADESVGQRFTCLNYYAPDAAGDERAYARLGAQRYGVPLVERALNEDFRLEELLTHPRTPVPVPYVGAMGIGRTDAGVAAAHRARAVFNGAGGDQLFFEMQCTWPAADYLKLRGIDGGLVQAVLESAHLGRVSFWHSLRRAFRDRGFRGNPVADAGRHLTLMRSDAWAAALNASPRYVHPCWVDAKDLPIGKFHQLGMLISPLEYYNHHLQDQAPERVHPLMSQPLLELCLSTPTFVLTHGGRGRGLARIAFADRIPAEVANRRSKGRIENYGVRVLRNNRAFARELLLDGLLAKEGLLDRHRAESALSESPGSNTTRASEIHAWLACEAWLRVVRAPATLGGDEG